MKCEMSFTVGLDTTAGDVFRAERTHNSAFVHSCSRQASACCVAATNDRRWALNVKRPRVCVRDGLITELRTERTEL